MGTTEAKIHVRHRSPLAVQLRGGRESPAARFIGIPVLLRPGIESCLSGAKMTR
jgi:hypothetical protein